MSNEVFVTSDSHFGHRGILSFPSTKPYRQFETIEDHDEELIRRWNEGVGPKDTVYHLGDFCFGKRNIALAGRLNGHKRLIMGNHDTYSSDEYLKYFDKLLGCHEYKGMILSHMPVHPREFPRYFMNIHGHLHTNHVLLPDGSMDYRYFNVACEQTNLTPIPIYEAWNYWAEHLEGK